MTKDHVGTCRDIVQSGSQTLARVSFLSGVALTSLLACAPALAQEAAASEGLEEIIVTARRQSENLQDVPASITALSQTALEQKAVRDIADLQQATPGLTVQGQRRADGEFVIRGQKLAGDAAPPGVIAYLNDVPAYGPEVARSFFDVESVQILKGPQGTLFGKNTNGGAILFNTRKPTAEFEGFAKARYGNLNNRYLEGMINVPLGDKAGLRVTGNIERRDGYTKNLAGPDVDNVRYGNLRASLHFEPNDVLSNDLVFNYTNSNERGPGFIISQFFNTPPLLQGGSFPAPIVAAATLQQSLGIRTISNSAPGFSKARAFGFSNTTRLKFSNFEIRNIVGYHDSKTASLADFDNLPFDLLSVDYARRDKQLTEELQIHASFMEDRLKLIAGGFYLSSSQDPYSGDTRFGASASGHVFTPAFFFNNLFIHRNEESRALFGQASFKVADTLTLTGGYRYTWDRAKLLDQQFRVFVPGTILLPFTPPASGFSTCGLTPPVGPSPLSVDLATCVRTGSAKFSAGNYTLTADWKPNDDILAYVTHRHGYKSGGFNVTSGFSGPANIYQPETLNDVEAGLKLQRNFGNVETRLNLSGFHAWYKDLQLSQVIIDATGPQQLIQNVGRARLWGGEAELTIAPVEGLNLGATLSYFDGKFTQGNIIGSNGVPTNLAGVAFEAQPKYTYSLSGAYTFDLGGEMTATPSVFYTWRKGYFFNYDRVPGNFIPSFGLLNARLDIAKIAGTPINVALFGKNITKKNYSVHVSRAETFGYLSRIYGEPRTYGIEASVRF